MNASEIKSYINELFDDEAILFAQILSLREPQTLDKIILRENKRPFCNKCGCEMKKNGTDGRGHQKWICKECGFTRSSNSGKPTERTRKNAATWLKMISCEFHGIPLRQSAKLCNLTLSTAFYIRHKIQFAISEVMKSVSLKGRVELDGKREKINLKGIKPKKMPRKSKHRKSGSQQNHHSVCVLFAIDEDNNMVAKIMGLGIESKEKAEAFLPYISGCTTLVTDDAHCYYKFASEHGFKHIRVKSSKHVNLDGESINRLNNLMSEYDVWKTKFRGISTKHLQGYLDRFLFQIIVKNAFDVLDQPNIELSSLLKSSAIIKCKEILVKAMPVDLYEAYGEYHHGIFANK